MWRKMDKEAFKESMMLAAQQEEEEEEKKKAKSNEQETNEEPVAAGQTKAEPKKHTKAKPGKQTEAEPGKCAKVKAEPVAAGRKKRRSKKKDAVMEEAVSEAIAKSNKQTEALRAAIQIMIDYTDGLTLKADKLINMADIYSGYIETLEEMTE